jgi:hypothetical protein
MSDQGRTHLNGDATRVEPERGLAEFQARSYSEKFDVMVARLEIEELREPEFLQALVYWHTRRAAKAMPARADLNPADLVRILPKIMLVDVLQREPYFKYRVFGTNIVDWIKFDATGQTIDKINPEKYRRMLFATYMECVGARQPIAHRILWDSEDIPHRYKRLMMPLAADGRNVDMLLITSVAEDFNEASEFWRNPTAAVRY